MKNKACYLLSVLCALCSVLVACDLQPKIAAIPESIGIGDFISKRYPALLADPEIQPEIYNSAVTDYGVYSSPDLYGSVNADDYIQYASVDDYALPKTSLPQGEEQRAKNKPVQEIQPQPVVNEYLKIPDYVVVAKPQISMETAEVTVAAGDTLYSLSRKYEIPVNDLAVMNNLGVPFALNVGQKLKVPKKLTIVPPQSVSVVTKPVEKPKATASATVSVPTAKPIETKEKVSSSASTPLPKIVSRTATKFSWPLRGKILSDYGTKSNGLFNDGINIAAKFGTIVMAAENGVVAYAGNELKGMGNLVIIQHSDGWMTVYAHLDAMNVRRGVKVSVGNKIGTVGQTGKVSEPQLHFEIRKGTKAYNPISQMKK